MTAHITANATEARLIRKLVDSGGYTPDQAAREVRRAHHESQAFRDATEGGGKHAPTRGSHPRRATEDPASDSLGKKRHKYGAKKITIDGHTFPSLAEGRRYEELKLMQQQGHINHLTLQPRYPIRIDGVLVTTYVADFRYQDVATGETVVEDVKGFKTAVYKLKRKLMQVVNGIDIQEIQA